MGFSPLGLGEERGGFSDFTPAFGEWLRRLGARLGGGNELGPAALLVFATGGADEVAFVFSSFPHESPLSPLLSDGGTNGDPDE